ncbi:MAG TPA: alpha/beta hydrolase [Actinocrinis sp.]|nr:alpha/beta hydrolase [Actinocrinis sp.]
MWSGDAATAAWTSLQAIQGQLSATEAYLVAFSALLQATADGLGEAKSVLAAAVTLAQQNEFTIHDDGTVTAGPASMTGAGSAGRARVAEVQQLTTQALTDARTTVDDLVAKLTDPEQFGQSPHGGNRESDADTVLAQDKAQDAYLYSQAVPAAGTDPATVDAWWQAQSPAQQQALITANPVAIGPLDGIPAVARNQANQIVLQAQISAYEQKIAVVQQTGSGMLSSMLLPGLQSQLTSLQTLQSEVAAGSTAVVNGTTVKIPMYLLGFGTQGNGQAIVAVGDPDTATNVSVYVPGLGSKLSNFGDNLVDATRMSAQADADTGSTSNSVITWLGYNAPGFTSVMSDGDAQAAVPALTNFLTSLHTVNSGLTNLSLVGDSYGSLVCGLAAAKSQLPITDLVFTGSPGVGVPDVDGLQVDPSHVWAGADYDDDVAALDWFGPDPVYQPFGANQFGVQHYGLGEVGTDAHSHYYDTGSESLNNVTDIITGNYNAVQLDHGPAAGPLYGQPGGPAAPALPFTGP